MKKKVNYLQSNKKTALIKRPESPPQQLIAVQIANPNSDFTQLTQRYFTPKEGYIPGYKSNTVSHTPVPIPQNAQQQQQQQQQFDDNKIVQNAPQSSVLDGFRLLEASNMGLPDDARQAILIDKGLLSVVEDDFTFFTGLMLIDVSENNLDIAPFGCLPRLKELRMACNNIKTVDRLFGFEKLLFLDLSYNKLTHRSVQSLDTLPSLRELDLCGNNLRGLPSEMYRFYTLEKLLLDNNKIDDNGIFSVLCTVPNLRHLSMAYNFLWKIPPECCAEGNFRYFVFNDI